VSDPTAPDEPSELSELIAQVFPGQKLHHKTGRPEVSSGNRARADESDIAKMQVIGLLRQGKSVKEAMAEVGRSYKTFYTWTKKSTKFRSQAEAAALAYENSEAKARMSVRERSEELEPVLRKDFPTWTEYVVAFRKQYFNFDTFDHQWQILQAWEASPPGGISVILVPPEAGKSTLLADTVIADLCDDPNMRRALVSEGSELASKIMGRIQNRMSYDGGEMSALVQHFGPFQPLASDRTKKWNSTQFTLLASDHDEQDPSVVSVGAGSNIRGARWDAVDLDDIQSLKSQNKTKWLLDIFRGDIVTRPGRHGRIRITGSRVCRGDFYEELERLDLIDELVIIPALDLAKPKGQQSYFPRQFDKVSGLPIVNEKGDQMGWSDDDLAQRRQKVGEDMWSRIYMMKPQSDFAAMLTPADIANATDVGRQIGAVPPTSVATIASLDPSLSNYAAMTACGYDAEHLYVMDLKNLHRLNTNQNLHMEIRRFTERYRPEWWVIENNTLQKGYLTDDAFLELKAQYGFHAVGHHTGTGKTSQDLALLGVPAMIDAIVRGEIRFPSINEHNGEDFATLFDQLLAWRPDVPTRRLTQDLVMALWFAYLRWRQLRQLVDLDISGWRRDGLGSVTQYPYAKSNLSGLDTRTPAPRTTRTYEQLWDELNGRQSA